MKFRSAIPAKKRTIRSQASASLARARRTHDRDRGDRGGDRGGKLSRSETAPVANYATRVMSGEFEPTAIKARAIAAQRGESLHQLAHDLGYAQRPPAARKSVDLDTISRSRLAEATGYDISDISRLFAHKHPPTLTKLARVAAAYGVWMDDMLTALGW